MIVQTEFLAMPLADWRTTRDALHGFARVLGGVRRALMPPQKHWWHITLAVSARGFTTTPMPGGRGSVELTMNLHKHCIELDHSDGAERSIPFAGHSAASMRDAVEEELRALGVGLPAADTAFDVTEYVYEPEAASRYLAVLSAVDLVFKEFKGKLREETGPVHLFPHHFDLSLNWFSGRLVPDADPADAENADEQMNFGFLTGDDSIDDAYFYATAYPLPHGLTDIALPGDSYWHMDGFTGAILRYDALADRPDAARRLLDFLVAAQRGGAERMR